MRLRPLTGLLLLALELAACGQKGSLYLPDKPPADVPPAEDTADEDVPENN